MDLGSSSDETENRNGQGLTVGSSVKQGTPNNQRSFIMFNIALFKKGMTMAPSPISLSYRDVALSRSSRYLDILQYCDQIVIFPITAIKPRYFE